MGTFGSRGGLFLHAPLKKDAGKPAKKVTGTNPVTPQKRETTPDKK